NHVAEQPTGRGIDARAADEFARSISRAPQRDAFTCALSLVRGNESVDRDVAARCHHFIDAASHACERFNFGAWRILKLLALRFQLPDLDTELFNPGAQLVVSEIAAGLHCRSTPNASNSNFRCPRSERNASF